MSSDWSIAKFGEVTINFDTRRKPVKEADRKPGPYPYYGASGVVDHVESYLFDGDYLLIAEDGENLRTRQTPIAFMASGKFWVNNHAHIVTGNEKASTRYLQYALLGTDIHPYLTGAVMPKLTQGNMNKIEVPCPPWSVQDKIVGVLGTLDDRIALLRETNATLEAIAQALFKSWFVDFDPVHAKQQGRAPEGMDEATAALFPDSFEESELGLVPRGWRLMSFGQLLSHTVGGDWGDEEPNEKNDIKVAIIRGTDIPDLHSGANHRVPIRYTSAKKLLNRKLQHGDIVIEVSGGSKGQPTGRSLYLTEQMLEQFDCSVEPASFCRLLRPISDDLGILLGQHLTYIYDQGKTWEYQNQSTGIANFQTTHFLETELVAIPSAEVLYEFANIVRPLIDRTHLSQMRQLAGLRDTLLPRLISGQLRLPEGKAETQLDKTIL
ncbi:MAG: restriction endonuclease subunit S [Methylomonas lenta]|nr:restriction endonuclease subunit S [Methylomonas lenta]